MIEVGVLHNKLRYYRIFAINYVVNIWPTLEESVSHTFRDCMFIKSVLQGVEIDVSPNIQGQSWKTWCMLSSVSGIIFRDNEEYILATCTYPNSFVADATTTKARACLQAVMVVEESMNRSVYTIVEEGKQWASSRILIEEVPPRAKAMVEEHRRFLI
ncbi:hypothetical protein PVK06_004271 [Gossypium arboreum]|uniref:Uncharacterized protein n=1 Tax=Gossypium arboreum TaxID=29729 RepID=A0ABR0QRJ9_GOSAR|nr:hypothetical protein PVK06_004271 [Gossypium arboreum]